MNGFKLHRLGLVMEPEPGNPQEIEGVLNPATVRGPDGKLYLFPRLVAQGNYSRVGITRVRFNEAGDPAGVERLGIALEPEADYERRPDGGGGCEDPRITFVEPLQCYLMTYTALSPQGPRIALALSEDLFHWKRLGLATFDLYQGIDFVHVDNKDASLFPVAIFNHAGKMQMALLHRPLFPGTRPEETACHPASRQVDLDYESIWISYCPMAFKGHETNQLGLFNSHHRLATPVSPWERLKIGGGTPPILTRHGWLIIYHGVSEMAESGNEGHHLCYSAGVMVLSNEHPRVIRYRSLEFNNENEISLTAPAHRFSETSLDRGSVSGVGACVAANKIPGVRAALITDSFSAHQGVEDDDMNVMCLGGRVTGSALSWDLVQVFLGVHFKEDERFRRRLAKVAGLERDKKS